MADVRYRPADGEAWRVAVAGSAVAALPPQVTPHTIEAVWRRLGAGGIAGLIEALTGAFGTSLTAIPPFALAVAEEGGVRIAVRGAVEVVVHSSSGVEEISGTGVATWVERLVPDAARVDISVGGESDAADDLPLADGIAPMRGVSLVVSESAASPASFARPAPAVAVATPDVSASEASASEAVTSAVVAPDAAAPEPAAAASEPDSDAAASDSDAAASDSDAAASAVADPDAEARVGAERDASAREAAATASESDASEPSASEPGAAEPSAESSTDEPAEAAASVAPTDPFAAAPVSPAGEAAAEATVAAPSTADTWLPIVTEVPRATSAPADAPPSAEPSPVAVPADDDIVNGETIARPRVAAPPAAAEPAASVSDPALGDHDGATIAVADLRAMREAERERFESTENVPARQPSQGRIRLSTGRVVELERPVVIGRRPKSTRTTGAELPTLVAVDSPEQDISRSHVEIRAEGEHVLVTDLDTTNGTVLHRVGSEPVRLHPSEPTMVVAGDVLDIGDGVKITFEDLP